MRQLGWLLKRCRRDGALGHELAARSVSWEIGVIFNSGSLMDRDMDDNTKPVATLADDVEEFEEKQKDFQGMYGAGGPFKERWTRWLENGTSR